MGLVKSQQGSSSSTFHLTSSGSGVGARATPPPRDVVCKLSMKAFERSVASRRSRFHKDNLRHLSRFTDLFVTLRILSAPPKTRESAKVHKQTNLSENRGWGLHDMEFLVSKISILHANIRLIPDNNKYL